MNPAIPRCVKTLILITAPWILIVVLLLPQWQEHSTEMAVLHSYRLGWLYAFLLVGIYWMFNILPIPVTGFIVLFVLPLVGMSESKIIASAFMSDYNIIVFGSVILMMAVDNCGLRRRLTLHILKHASGCPRWMFTDVFLSTMWISMWINSAAAVFFMIKVIDDILDLLKAEVSKGTLGDARMVTLHQIQNNTIKSEVPKELSTADVEANKVTSISEGVKSKELGENKSKPAVDPMTVFESENEQLLNDFGGELLYASAVAANIGGMLWPFGNAVGSEVLVSEATWMVYSLPLLLINATIAFVYLYWVQFGKMSPIKKAIVPIKPTVCDFHPSPETSKRICQIFSEKHIALPPWSSRERTIVALMIVAVSFCLFRQPFFFPGWADVLAPLKATSITGDSVSYTIIILLIFLLPSWGLKVFRGPPPPNEQPKPPTNLGWKKLQSTYPFAALVLIGAAGCLGRFSQKAVAVPIANYLSKTLTLHGDSGELVLKILLILMTVGASFFMPNTGISVVILKFWQAVKPAPANILPILSATSLCFVIPASSIPTAMVYTYKGKKTLSAWYFLRIGMPLFLCTLISTVIYAILWQKDSLLSLWRI